MLKLDPFYPIVPDTEWLARLLAEGVRFAQLRIKNAEPATVRAELRLGLELARARACELVINDYWREAIEAGASFVHLGQEDLAGADLGAIKAAGLKLGVSTHSPEELDTALEARPDYVALGPIFPTKLKEMSWAPQGVARIAEWKARIAAAGESLPLVAIGGIDLARAPAVLEAGADCVAVITDILAHRDPALRTRQFLAATAPFREISTSHPQG